MLRHLTLLNYLIVLQRELEGISEALRIPGNKSLGPVAKVYAILLMQNTLLQQVVDSCVTHLKSYQSLPTRNLSAGIQEN